MSNKEVVSLEGVVKSDSSVEQRVYFIRELQRRSRASIKERLFEGSIGLRGGSIVYFVRRGGLLRIVGRESPTYANLGNDQEFTSKEYISLGTRPFGKTQNKATRAYTQSGQYRTIMMSRDS